MSQKVTAAMVAEKAGVSPATMSRYLSDPEGVRRDSAKKIEDALQAMDITADRIGPKTRMAKQGALRAGTDLSYEKNLPGAGFPGSSNPASIQESGSGIPLQGMSGGEAGNTREPIIVVNIPGLVNTFYNGILHGIQTSARMHGCRVLIYEAALNSRSVGSFCDLLRDVHASGAILMNMQKKEGLEQIRSIVPLVQCSEYNETAGFPYVSIDDRAAARAATQYLISCGCNKISLINSSPTFRYARMRQQGFLEAMEEAENFVPQSWIVQLPEVDYTLAYSAVCRILNEDTRPNAFFAVSDIYAISVLRAARRFGLRIPQDLMVIGFDNLDVTAMTCPSITSVSQSSYQQGYSACELRADLMEQPDLEPKPILIDTELVLRESTYMGLPAPGSLS